MSAQKISPLEQSMVDQGMLHVQDSIPSIWVELKYATTDNFTGVVLYDRMLNAYLHPLALQKLRKAQTILQKSHPGLSLLVYDAVRPLSIQQKMFDVVKGTPQQAYVANPSKTGLHNYGMAVDLTICDEKGFPLDMGTPFDYFGKAAAIRDEEGLVEDGLLTPKQVANRRLLRKVMTDAGFYVIQGEWWHFNAVTLENARKNYQVIE
ncbi:M15 family metallopeptidase [Dysgonomonas sp. 25]|uniref:M15 family metallopeptidase n=1 Tax=Dysgonomonas sp. 25 TaxID=2302933 RepID=UPI002106A47C|nr:M15 family metallopeptidase [Dysgonomonas sp. 25]